MDGFDSKQVFWKSVVIDLASGYETQNHLNKNSQAEDPAYYKSA